MNTDEYAPTIRPMKSANEMSRRVPAPSRIEPMNKIEATGRIATTEVLIERTRVWFTARFTRSEKVLV